MIRSELLSSKGIGGTSNGRARTTLVTGGSGGTGVKLVGKFNCWDGDVDPGERGSFGEADAGRH